MPVALPSVAPALQGGVSPSSAVTPSRAFRAVGPEHPVAAPAPAAARPPEGQPSSWRLALDGLERARTELDRAIASARNGRTFSPGELLALQSQAFRYGQSVEVASKIAEQAAQSVKQAVNTQV